MPYFKITVHATNPQQLMIEYNVKRSHLERLKTEFEPASITEHLELSATPVVHPGRKRPVTMWEIIGSLIMDLTYWDTLSTRKTQKGS